MKDIFAVDPAEVTGKVLAKEDRVRVRIPLNPLNEDDKVVPVCVNGYNYFVNRGEAVEVPKTVAEILEAASYI